MRRVDLFLDGLLPREEELSCGDHLRPVGCGFFGRSVGRSTVSQVRLVFGCSFTGFLRRSVRSLPSWTLWM